VGGALAWNGLFVAGVEGASTPNHMLEHPLSGIYNVAHGAGLSIVIPAWLKYMKPHSAHRIVLFGSRILRMETKLSKILKDKSVPQDTAEIEAADLVIDELENGIGTFMHQCDSMRRVSKNSTSTPVQDKRLHSVSFGIFLVIASQISALSMRR